MKSLFQFVFFKLPALLVALLLIITLLVWQSGMMSRADFNYLVDYGNKHGIVAVWNVISAEVFGYEDIETNPDYGRELVEGRGHAPWVIRGNLDGQPRVISFALAPNVWAAYHTSSASLYQVWKGDVLFQGANYDYRHGPQPEARGEWYVRNDAPARWFIGLSKESANSATVTYLGHKYGEQRRTASMRFELSAGGQRLSMAEYPEFTVRNGEPYLHRQFRRLDSTTELTAWYQHGDGPLQEAGSDIMVALAHGTAIPEREFARLVEMDGDEISYGEQVIANSDCLSCHATQHDVAGPSWSRIAGRYRGYLQEESLTALAAKVINGGTGAWGKQIMTAHPDMTKPDARAAIAYILSQPTPELNNNAPLDDDGNPFVASTDYDANAFLTSVHPGFTLTDILPKGFEPKVGGMDFRADGQLLVSSWDADGTVFLVDPSGQKPPRRIAEGLHEPLGLSVVGNDLYVLQKQELTQLIDHNGDDVIDEYRAVSQDWPTTSNFHSFAFGLEHQNGYVYALLSICVLPGGASCPDQLATQGKLLKVSLADGKAMPVASGFRTPNGIGVGENGQLFVTDNQGDWLPASKLVHIEADGFYGSRAVPDAGILEREEIPPVVWLPQDEIGNSPSQPLLLTEGPYAGQMIFGDVTNGGIKRVFMENINDRLQGAAFHFSAGFKSSVNRLVRGPGGDIFVGEVGNPPNWSEIGKLWHGIEKLSYTGKPAYEMLSVEATPEGFIITLTEPLSEAIAPSTSSLMAKQWFYHPTEQYGGPKYDVSELVVSELRLSEDRRQLNAIVPGLKPGYVVYLRLDEKLLSTNGNRLWVSEAWYTLNAIPAK